jgi:hypothetical protein
VYSRTFFTVPTWIKPIEVFFTIVYQRIRINQAHHLSPPANPPATAIAKVKITKSSDG